MPMRLLCETALLFTLIHTGWMRQTTVVIEGAPSRTGLFLHKLQFQARCFAPSGFFFAGGVFFSLSFLPLLPPFENSSESRPLTFWSLHQRGNGGKKHYRFCVLSDSNIKECVQQKTQDRGLDCFPCSLALNGRARNPRFWLRHPASWSSQEPYSSNPCFCAINPWVNQILLDRPNLLFLPWRCQISYPDSIGPVSSFLWAHRLDLLSPTRVGKGLQRVYW